MMHRPARPREYARRQPSSAAHRTQRVRALRLVERVADHSGIAVDEIVGPSMQRPASNARAACAWLIRRIDRLALAQVALMLGRAAPKSAINMIARADQLRAADPAIRQLIETILGEESMKEARAAADRLAKVVAGKVVHFGGAPRLLDPDSNLARDISLVVAAVRGAQS